MRLLAAVVVSFVAVACRHTPTPAPPAAPPAAAPAAAPSGASEASEASVKPGANKQYLDPGLDVDAWAERFEKEGRETFDKRNEIVAATGLRPGAAVADVGAGSGLFTLLFAHKVGPSGKVYAVDIAPKFLALIDGRAKERGATNVKTVLGTERSVELPPGSVDLVFLCDTYHHFEYPKSSLASIFRALRPGGELFLIDFKRIPGQSAAWIFDHVRAGEETFTAEIEAAGFQKVETLPILRENYVIRFRRK